MFTRINNIFLWEKESDASRIYNISQQWLVLQKDKVATDSESACNPSFHQLYLWNSKMSSSSELQKDHKVPLFIIIITTHAKIVSLKYLRLSNQKSKYSSYKSKANSKHKNKSYPWFLNFKLFIKIKWDSGSSPTLNRLCELRIVLIRNRILLDIWNISYSPAVCKLAKYKLDK